MQKTPSIALIFASTLLAAVQASAGPLQPCITATLSANGGVLVLNELTESKPDSSGYSRLQKSTFRLFHRLQEPAPAQPDSHWDLTPTWILTLQAGQGFVPPACPFTFVTNNAEFLILASRGLDPTALSIYRRRAWSPKPPFDAWPEHGVLVRKIPLREIWPEEHIPKMLIDGQPVWYRAGSFAFSSDNCSLLYNSPWGSTFQIDLPTGKVTKL